MLESKTVISLCGRINYYHIKLYIYIDVFCCLDTLGTWRLLNIFSDPYSTYMFELDLPNIVILFVHTVIVLLLLLSTPSVPVEGFLHSCSS